MFKSSHSEPIQDPQFPPLDEFHEVQRQLMEALDRGDALHEKAEASEEIGDEDDGANDIVDGLEELYTQATTAIYPGSRTSIVSATIIIMNMCTVFHVSNKFTDELLRFLSVDLLTAGNKLPGTHYQARRNIRRVGLHYNNVHACCRGCVIYQGEYEAMDSCPKCSTSRWTDNTNHIPSKVIRHFPLIPRLKRMWRLSEIARMLQGYTKHISHDSVMCSMVDSLALKHIDSDVAFNNFEFEVRNMRLALALDGVNPLKLNNTNWATWLVLIMIYNLEPWFVTKKFFISLSILISRKQSPTSESFDVFIRPLLRKFQELWHGVPTLDFSQPEHSRNFTLRAIFM